MNVSPFVVVLYLTSGWSITYLLKSFIRSNKSGALIEKVFAEVASVQQFFGGNLQFGIAPASAQAWKQRLSTGN